MGFWKDEDCEYCDTPLDGRVVDIPRKIGKQHILLGNVPVGICRKCGKHNYASNVLKLISDKKEYTRKILKEKVEMAVVNM